MQQQLRIELALEQKINKKNDAFNGLNMLMKDHFSNGKRGRS